MLKHKEMLVYSKKVEGDREKAEKELYRALQNYTYDNKVFEKSFFAAIKEYVKASVIAHYHN